MMAEMDLTKRDPNDLNSHIKVSFEDVLAEPDDVHSIDCIWSVGYSCFTCGRNCCYKFLTLLTGLCIALFWGCTFAIISCTHIWCCTPCLRCLDVNCNVVKKCNTMFCNCGFAPLCETCGLFFSRIIVSNK